MEIHWETLEQILVYKYIYVGSEYHILCIQNIATIKLIVIITGGGSLFSAGGAAESKTTNKPESTVLFAVSGVVGESFGKGNYTASGTSTFSGAGIEKQTDDYVGTGSATLSGTADTDRTRAFAGSGSLFSTGGAAEIAVVDYVLTLKYTCD